MNINHRGKIILLWALLVITISLGCMFLVGSVNRWRAKDTPTVNDVDSTVTGAEAEYQKYYVGEALTSMEYNPFNSNIQQYGDQIVTFDGMDAVDFSTKEFVFTMPDSILLPDCKIAAFCLDADKNIGCLYSTASQTAFFQQWDESGMPIGEKVALQDIDRYLLEYNGNKYLDIKQIEMDDNHIYILLSYGKTLPSLLVYDRTGNINFSLNNVHDFDIDNAGKLYVASADLQSNNKGYACLDSEKGTMEYFGKSKYYIRTISLDKVSGTIYAKSNNGVEIYSAKDGAFIEEAINWIKDSLSGMQEEIFLIKFKVDNKGSMCFIYSNPDTNQRHDYIYRIGYGERKEIPYTLTLQAPYRTNAIANAIMKFERDNPSERIKCDYAYLDRREFYQNREEYSNKLSLKLISGNSADIVVLGASRVSYLDMLKTDVFLDLTKLIEQDAGYKDLDENILEAMKVDGKIRALPLTHSFPFVQINTALLQQLGMSPDFENMTWSGFLDLVDILEKKHTDVALLTNDKDGNSIKSNLNIVIINNIPDLINLENKTVDLEQKWFVDLMQKWKKASNNLHMCKTIKSSPMDRFQGQTLVSIDITGQEIAESSDGDLFTRYKKYNDVPGQKMTCVPIFKGEKNANRFGLSENLFAISNASKNKDSAWKFLSFALTDEVQGMRDLYGRVLNKTERAKRMQASVDNLFRETDASEYTGLLDNISDSIDYMYVFEGYWEDLAIPMQDYMDDKITLDEALKTAEHDIWIRLNE